MNVLAGLFPFVKIDGIDFDPFIRGWLVVGVAVLVLYGSICLVIGTNTGARTGLLITLTALFGWFTIMGSVWWIYGIGLKGPTPKWRPIEVNRGDLTVAKFDNARQLGIAITDLEKAEGVPLVKIFQNEEEAGNPLIVGDWKGMLLANSARGEAQATVDAFLVGRKDFESTTEYIPIGAFESGGKQKRGPDAICKTQNIGKIVIRQGCWKRAGAKLHTIFVQPFHPARHAVILVQPTDQRTLVARPGQAPPVRQVDPNQAPLAIIMERDLGSLRLPPAMICLLSLTLFSTFAWMLHTREKREIRHRSQALVPLGGH